MRYTNKWYRLKTITWTVYLTRKAHKQLNKLPQSIQDLADLADVVVKPSGKVNQSRLKKMIRSTLDQYLIEDRVPAKAVHDAAKKRHGEHYRTVGYYLRVYRERAELTQVELAEQTGIRQHHLSEMENNKRVIGKVNAKKLAGILGCDYRKLL